MGNFGFLKSLGRLKRLKLLLAPLEFVGRKVAILVNYVLLTAVYFTAFAATAAIAKIVRKRFLELKPDLSRKSYWIEKKKENYSSKDSYRPF